MNILWRGSDLQRVRLVAGLILFAFATTHFVNHALGLVSLDAMVAFESWRLAVNGSLPGTIILGGALVAHAGLAILKLVRRRTLTMPFWEWAQIVLGLAIPFQLLPHIVNTRMAFALFGIDATYPYEIVRIWPGAMIPQTLLLIVVWVHGCIGLHYWLRLSRVYGWVAPYLGVLALLLPFAAISGIAVQGMAKDRDVALAGRFDLPGLAARWPSGDSNASLGALSWQVQLGFALVLLAMLLVVLARWGAARFRQRLRIQYLPTPLVRTAPGPTLLEISRANGIPHMSVCGGRGRCSTCRVLILSSLSGLEPASDAELKTLRAIGAAANVRLACQARPRASVTLSQIVQVKRRKTTEHLLEHAEFGGVEQDVAILFVDIRGFTPLTEQKLAYDIVFILNQFFAAVGKPIYDLGGWIGNYAGDGIMALFTHEDGVDAACRAATEATTRITAAIAALNLSLKAELPRPLRVAMGLHSGPLVLGRLGYADTMTMSVVGSAVNIASRLEALAKAADVELVLSRDTASRAGLELTGLRSEAAAIRGSANELDIVYVERTADLAARAAPALGLPA